MKCLDHVISSRRSLFPHLSNLQTLRMALNFCPECGSKLKTGFKFCPSCGVKLPSLTDLAQADSSTSSPAALQISVTDGPVTAQPQCSPGPTEAQQLQHSGDGPVRSISASPRSPLCRTWKSTKVTESVSVNSATLLLTASPKSTAAGLSPKDTSKSSPQKRKTRAKANQEVDLKAEVLPRLSTGGQSPKALQSPRKRPAHANVKQEEEASVRVSPSSSPRSPAGVKKKGKRTKHASVLEPLGEGEQVTDTAGRKWELIKLLSQSDTEIIYGVQQDTTGASSADYKHILKLASKDGKIFNEQNFLQRAAKPVSVKNWMKLKKMDVLGIPSCVGFGLHADSYRFLIFPNMGRTLQSIVEEGRVLSEKAVLQLSCRILDVLEYIHENEYIHANIHSENIYIDLTKPTQVYLVGYCHAFRYCPRGKHVEYREASRASHEGALEFISVESHKGAGPSRRSDLQALGYCMLSWLAGTLPWTSLSDCPAKVMAEKERYMTDVQGLMSHCFGKKKVPGAVNVYLSQVMSLQYTEEPHYQQLRDGLLGGLQKLGASLDQPIDLQA
ncbi:inactive serine/threonine-protein kinase VRK3 isoform X1 [Conger conger]|uniref:inactive serine/threonine-protein kinase VRK3 isoform X1 n=2 Tax=Conger conger TaxID=82655 RepID=UPI002A59B703|nr:inactive serine/threonine-protein kinase VRK3 isoform X1 [Conger conger]